MLWNAVAVSSRLQSGQRHDGPGVLQSVVLGLRLGQMGGTRLQHSRCRRQRVS